MAFLPLVSFREYSIRSSVSLYGCETWPHLVREENRLKISEKRRLCYKWIKKTTDRRVQKTG
jgi:hypothetical protein